MSHVGHWSANTWRRPGFRVPRDTERPIVWAMDQHATDRLPGTIVACLASRSPARHDRRLPGIAPTVAGNINELLECSYVHIEFECWIALKTLKEHFGCLSDAEAALCHRRLLSTSTFNFKICTTAAVRRRTRPRSWSVISSVHLASLVKKSTARAMACSAAAKMEW